MLVQMNKNTLPHDRSHFFTTSQYKNAVIDFFITELHNDGDDITSTVFIPSSQQNTAKITAKQNGILAGQKEIELFIKSSQCPFTIQFHWNKTDGDNIHIGEQICEISGKSKDILRIERLTLNVLSRMSGIATTTHNIQKKSHTPIAGTRKTQWSFLDKKAIFIGGGNTHRIGLFDAILVKENHLIAGTQESVFHTLLHIENTIPQKTLQKIQFIEVEVENINEFYEVFSIFLKRHNISKNQYKYVIMLDNFSPQDISHLFQELTNKGYTKQKRNQYNIFIEISGGITKDNIHNYSNLGADVISLGSLTHSVLPIDFSLRF